MELILLITGLAGTLVLVLASRRALRPVKVRK